MWVVNRSDASNVVLGKTWVPSWDPGWGSPMGGDSHCEVGQSQGWRALGSSMSLELTQFPSFLWLSNIPLSIYETQLLHPLRYRWTSRLIPCPGCCKQRCSVRWGTHTTVSLSTDGHLGCFCILTVVNNGQI